MGSKATDRRLVWLLPAAFLLVIGCSRKEVSVEPATPAAPWATIARSTLDTVDFQLSAPAFNYLTREQRIYGWYIVRAVASLPVDGLDSTEAQAARGAVVDNIVNALDYAPEAPRPALRALVRAFQQNTGAAWREYSSLYRVLPLQPVEFFFEPTSDFSGRIRQAGALVRDDDAQSWIDAAAKAFGVTRPRNLGAYQALTFNSSGERLFRRRSEPLLRRAGRPLLIVNTPPNLPGFTPCDILPAGLAPSQRHNLSPEIVARFTAVHCLMGLTGARAEAVTRADGVKAAFISEMRPVLIGLRYACRTAALTRIGLPETGLSDEAAVGVFLARSLAEVCALDTTGGASEVVDPAVLMLVMLLEEGLVSETELEGQTVFAFDAERVLNRLDVWSDDILDEGLLNSLMSVTPARARAVVTARLPRLWSKFTVLKPRAVIWHYPPLEAVRNKMGGVKDVRAP